MKGAKMINIYIFLLFLSVSVSCSSDNIAKENCSLYSMSINAILDNYQMTHKMNYFKSPSHRGVFKKLCHIIVYEKDRASSVPTNKD